jgi:16S rRNA (guanine527-N7)-methyltransferase
VGAHVIERSAALTTTQEAQLDAYLALLQKWNGVYNLTSIRSSQEMRTLHLADCLAVVPHFPEAGRVLDVGSGGGLPGIVLAITKPQLQLTLCDTVQKKCAFLQQVKGELQLANVDVQHARVETLLGEFDVITSRAFAELALMVQLTRHLLKPQGYWLAMKGIAPDAEIAALPKDLQAQITPLEVPGLNAARCLVKISSC